MFFERAEMLINQWLVVFNINFIFYLFMIDYSGSRLWFKILGIGNQIHLLDGANLPVILTKNYVRNCSYNMLHIKTFHVPLVLATMLPSEDI